MSRALLEVKDLSVHFPVRRGWFEREQRWLRAVDGVSFTIQGGRTLGLVGESGCGKSTTARAIVGLNTPTAGEIHFAGKRMADLDGPALREARRGMQMVFQDPYSSLDPRMMLGDIIAEPLRAHRVYRSRTEERKRVAVLMDQVGLATSMSGRYPHELSGGQRQRAGIARALALKPRLVIADEPVSALDMSIRAQIINLLGELQDELSIAYLFIAHDLAVVRHTCDEVVVMYLGRIVERAPRERLFTAAEHPYTQALLDAVLPPRPMRDRRSLPLLGDVPSPVDPPSGCAFHPRCAHAVEECRVETPGLEARSHDHEVACHLTPDEWRGSDRRGADA